MGTPRTAPSLRPRSSPRPRDLLRHVRASRRTFHATSSRRSTSAASSSTAAHGRPALMGRSRTASASISWTTTGRTASAATPRFARWRPAATESPPLNSSTARRPENIMSNPAALPAAKHVNLAYQYGCAGTMTVATFIYEGIVHRARRFWREDMTPTRARTSCATRAAIRHRASTRSPTWWSPPRAS
jgi:hypothetical protein